MDKNTISINYKKSLVSAIIIFSIYSTISCRARRDTGLLKDRVIKRRHQQELAILLDEIGTYTTQQALNKIKDLQTLLNTLQANSVNQAQETIENLRTEYGSTIQNMQDKMQLTIQNMKNEYQLTIQSMQNEIQQVLTMLNTDNLDKALKKINELQNSYNQIIQFAQNLDRPKNTKMPTTKTKIVQQM